jgi:hypothetical protein
MSSAFDLYDASRRLRFFSQEIVLFRDDLQSRMMRLTCIPPQMEETTSVFEHLAMTVLQQGHLCPLPLNVQPIYWDFDHALRLYSSPHAVRPLNGEQVRQAVEYGKGARWLSGGAHPQQPRCHYGGHQLSV